MSGERDIDKRGARRRAEALAGLTAERIATLDDWLSLDEAPKDGRLVLVKFASGAVCPGCWSPELQSWAFDLADVPADMRHWTSHPVGWRPLDESGTPRGAR